MPLRPFRGRAAAGSRADAEFPALLRRQPIPRSRYRRRRPSESESLFHGRERSRGDGFDVAAGIDHGAALGFGGGDREEALTDALVIVARFGLEPRLGS